MSLIRLIHFDFIPYHHFIELRALIDVQFDFSTESEIDGTGSSQIGSRACDLRHPTTPVNKQP